MDDSDLSKNPWSDVAESGDKGEFDDFMKPMRLAKRTEEKQNTHEQFQFRPIRLGSRKKLEDDKAGARGGEENAPESPVSQKTEQTERSDRSDHSNPTTPRRRSIQIRNLPIVESPKRYVHSQVDDAIFAVCLVDFHHSRGPEVEFWRSNYHDKYTPSLFKNLPFQALPDGSHQHEETFSNFSLVYDFANGLSYDDGDDYDSFQGDPRHLRTLFGCACVRQVLTGDLSELELARNKDITRLIVQKAIVVVACNQPIFTKIKDKLSIITHSFLIQERLDNYEVLDHLFENLNESFKPKIGKHLSFDQEAIQLEREDEFFVNLNLKETVSRFRHSFLAVFKAMLLEKRILIYSNNNLESLTMFQNNLISLVPNLIHNLADSSCPLIDYTETNGPLKKPESLVTTSRLSMLRFFGLPLQLFNTKGAFWNPYLPLQQLNALSSPGTKTFMVGCLNLLFVNQLVRLKVDVLVNLDTHQVTYPVGKGDELMLSLKDKTFINSLLENMRRIDEQDGFVGSDDYIRYKFEDYLCSLLSTTKYAHYVDKFKQPPPGFAHTTTGTEHDANDDVSVDNGNLAAFEAPFVEAWTTTKNYAIWDAMSDEFIFNFLPPRHYGADIADTRSRIASVFDNFRQRLNPPLDPKSLSIFESVKNDSDKNDKANEPSVNEVPFGKKLSSWASAFKRK